jgi:6-phosphogluconolactonase (cycloisomerase 2 family)
MIRLRSLGVLLASSILCAACGGGGGGTSSTTYTVTYSANGATGGAVPVDSTRYSQGQTVTVLGNTGSLVNAGHAFAGWNTAAGGTGTHYLQGQTFTCGSADVSLFAQWTTSGGGLTVTYDANGATGGVAPVDSNTYSGSQTVTVLGNTGNLVHGSYRFAGWQTEADGSGATYAAGSTFSMGAASVTLHALWAGGYAYAVNWSDSNVSQYVIGPNGALSPMFTPSVPTGGYDPRFLTVDPSGKYLYVSNYHGVTSIPNCTYGCGFVSQFTIGADGSLAALDPPTFFTAGPYPAGGAVHPTKPWYYVTNSGWGTVSQNTIGADGALTAMNPALVTAGVTPNAVAIDPSGKYAYVPNGPGNTVSQYDIDQTTGALTAMSTPTVPSGGYNAWEIKIVPIASGTYAYVANYGGNNNNQIAQYKIGTDGALASMGTISPAPGVYSLSIAVDPKGRFAYVPINYSQTQVIAQFKINQATGALEANGTVGAAGTGAAWMAIDSSGKYAYATSGDTGWGSTSITQFTIDQTTGALTPMSKPTVRAGSGPSEIVTVGW